VFLESFNDSGAVLRRLDDRLVVYRGQLSYGEGCCEVYSIVEGLHHENFVEQA